MTSLWTYSLRLPAKSVGLCRCVSKRWRALLIRPDFIRAHLHVSMSSGQESLTFFGNRLGLLIAHLWDAQHLSDKVTLSPTAVDFSFDGRPCVWGIVYGSCNGLVLASTFELFKINLFVLNPTTRELRQLAPLPYRRDDVSCFVGIRGGIGYDSMNDDYKVVDISYHHYRDRKTKSRRIRMFIDIYSLKSGSWKRPACFPCNPPYNVSNPPWIGEVWGLPSYGCGEIRILGSMGHGEVVLWVDKNKLVVYNVKEGTFKDIVVMASISDRSTVNFVESLVSPVTWW